jgi:hypothetical protein
LVRALKALGETVEVAPPSGPVRFRLLDHGAPLAGMDTGIELCYEGSGSHLSTSRTSDNDGVVSLDRDFFVDPQNPISAVVFRTRGRLWDGRVHPEDPVLALWQPTPNDLRFADRADLQWSFVLDESRGPKSVIPYSPALGRDLPPSGQIVFPKVARGAYVLKVRKKTKLLVSTTFDMAGQDQTIDLSEP